MTQEAGNSPPNSCSSLRCSTIFCGLQETPIHDSIDGVVDFKALFKYSVRLLWRINLDNKSLFLLTAKVALILELAPPTSQIHEAKKLTIHVKFRHLPSGISQDSQSHAGWRTLEVTKPHLVLKAGPLRSALWSCRMSGFKRSHASDCMHLPVTPLSPLGPMGPRSPGNPTVPIKPMTPCSPLGPLMQNDKWHYCISVQIK